MFIRLIVVYFAVALIWLLIVPASPVGAQIVSGNYPNPQVHLKPSVLEHFDIVLPALARQGRVAVVCEGQPLHLKLTADQTQELAQRINPNGMPLEDAVKWVAAAYDYRAQRTGANIFVLTKRYTYTDDLPDVPFEEAKATCLLDFYNLVQPSTSYVSNFDKATLTLNQDKGDPTQIGFVVDAPDGNGGGTGVSGQVGWTEFRQYAP